MAIMSMQAKNKIRTNSQDEKINETSSLSEADKISSLPNDVLLNILSLLPMENAVATSVLSKRWRHVWTQIIRVLDFSCWEFDRRVHKGCTDDFDDFLVVLEISYLDLVRCRFNGVLDSKCVSTCLASLLKRGFYKLELVCERTWPIMLPSSLLACEELVELKLFGDFTIRDLPSSLHWPNLKVVLIEDVDLADRDSLEDLLRGCPVLEKLYINNCKIKIRGTTSIDVCSSSLKILQYIACQYSLIRLMVKSIDTPNLEHLHLTNVEVLEVGAPNLRCLKLHDFLLSNDSYTKEMVLKDLLMGCHVLEELYLTNFQSREATLFDVCSSSLNILQYDTCQTVRNRFRIDTPNLRHLYLTTAEVVELRAPKLRCLKLRDFVFCEGFDMEEMPFIAETCLDPSSDCLSIVLKVLHTVSGLKALDLGIQVIRSLQGVSYRLKEMPVFSNLSSLKVELTSWNVVLDLLQLAPNLKSFSLTYKMELWRRHEWRCPPSAPKCLLVLEQVTFDKFMGDKYGEEIIRYFLRKAKLLKKIEVTTLSEHFSKKNKLIQTLNRMSRASTSCEIIVY